MSNFSVAYRGHKVSHCTRASRGLVDVKPCKQIICNPRFWREIELVRLRLKSNSQYFAILINSQSKKPAELNLCQWEEIVIIEICRERALSENRMKRKRLSDQKRQEVT